MLHCSSSVLKYMQEALYFISPKLINCTRLLLFIKQYTIVQKWSICDKIRNISWIHFSNEKIYSSLWINQCVRRKLKNTFSALQDLSDFKYYLYDLKDQA